jgi:hypothetical protein
MGEGKHRYERLLQHGFSQPEIHRALDKFIWPAPHHKAGSVVHFATKDSKALALLIKRPNTGSLPVGKALSLLKSQFAKKPKNPV